MRHNSAHAFCLLLHSVLGEVQESHRTILRGSISHLEDRKRVFGGSPETAEGRASYPRGMGKNQGESRRQPSGGKQGIWAEVRDPETEVQEC